MSLTPRPWASDTTSISSAISSIGTLALPAAEGVATRRIARRLSARLKSVAGWILFQTGLFRLLWRDRAVIVVFHRVNEAYPDDPLTLTDSVFERFVQFFARYFDVIPLSELLNRLAKGGALAPSLTITFDDGYWGNATIAAPILERNGLRGCFFLTTEFIGSDFVPWWDQQQRIQSRWMSWDQVRALRAAGHEIGSHTETHVDLGKVPTDIAQREVAGGDARLAKELGESTGLFAYPFGGSRNMSPENHAVISKLGLRCSVSAHGGYVLPGDDPFRLKRVNISNWFASPYQFGFELVTGRLAHETY